MRLRLWMLAILIVWLCVIADATVLQNGSFEIAGEADDRAAAWSRWGHWFNRETMWQPTRSGRCLLGYHHWRIERPDSSGVWQDVQGIRPGSIVTFSVYATRDSERENEEPFSGVELRLETTLYGEQSTVASRTWPAEAVDTNGRWSRLAVRSVLPTDTLRVLIIVYPGPGKKARGGAIKFDEARVVVEDPLPRER